jgi:hypothetical protein
MRRLIIASLLAWAPLCLIADGIGSDQVASARQLSQSWKVNTKQGQVLFPNASTQDQYGFLVGTANGAYKPNAEAALVLLSQMPYDQGIGKVALLDEAKVRLYRLGYRQPGDATAFLGEAGTTRRPWTRGIGLHLEEKTWRAQLMPSTGFLPSVPQGAEFPKALHRAGIPSVLIHMKQLRAGMDRLSQLAGGAEGSMLRTAADGTRAGFLLRHIEPWLKKGETALEPLANREAWILHYGQRSGTLIFVPGSLPTRTELSLSLLKLNPFSKGARNRKALLKVEKRGEVNVDEIRASGGVLYLATTPEGTWISDRESVMKDLYFPPDGPLLGDRLEWSRSALAAQGSASVSFWMIPRQAMDASYECSALRLRAKPRNIPMAPSALLKAAPRGSALSLSLGAGPTALGLERFLVPDDPYEIEVPKVPAFADGGSALTAVQKRDYQIAVQKAKQRIENRKSLRIALDKLTTLLEQSGASMHWNGWTPAPPLSESEKAALVAFRKQGYWMNAKQERMNRAPGFGGYGEPGLTPSAAMALPLKAGKAQEADALLKQLFANSFKGSVQMRAVGAVQLRRVKVEQAFAPSWALVGDTLVLGSDDRAVASTVAGLQGEAPTLADLPNNSWGTAEIDGERLASEMESLLTRYLRSHQNVGWWDENATAQSADEIAKEVSSTFGPFLDLIRQQGRVGLSISLSPSGFEIRPK